MAENTIDAALAHTPKAATCAPEGLADALNEVAKTAWPLDLAAHCMGTGTSDQRLITTDAGLTLGELRFHLKAVRKLGERLDAAPPAPQPGAGGESTLRLAASKALAFLDEAAGRGLIFEGDSECPEMDAAELWKELNAALYAGVSAAPAAPAAEPDAGVRDDLDARLKAAGMFTVPEMMGATPLTRWVVHAGMTDLDAFSAWLDRLLAEKLRMRAAYELGDADKGDELYEWVLAHCAALSAVRENFVAARAAALAHPQPASPELGARLAEKVRRLLVGQSDIETPEGHVEWLHVGLTELFTLLTDAGHLVVPTPSPDPEPRPAGAEGLREALTAYRTARRDFGATSSEATDARHRLWDLEDRLLALSASSPSHPAHRGAEEALRVALVQIDDWAFRTVLAHLGSVGLRENYTEGYSAGAFETAQELKKLIRQISPGFGDPSVLATLSSATADQTEGRS